MDNGASSYRRFLDGDEAGLIEIIRDYKDGLMLYLNGFVDNIYTAEDMTEETFVKLVVKRPKFSAKSTFKTWLYAIGRNVAIDYTRRLSKTAGRPIEAYHHRLSDEERLERSYLREEQKVMVHQALKKLRPEYRQVLHLIYFEDFYHSQAAAVMGKNKRQIENLVYRAKLSLKSVLENGGFHYEEL